MLVFLEEGIKGNGKNIFLGGRVGQRESRNFSAEDAEGIPAEEMQEECIPV